MFYSKTELKLKDSFSKISKDSGIIKFGIFGALMVGKIGILLIFGNDLLLFNNLFSVFVC